jgi:predicted NBD/HSP70 family sugar kinase
LKSKGITRLEIGRQAELSLGTVKTIVEEFLQIGIIKEVKDNSTTVGRKPKIISLQPDSRLMIILHFNRLHFQYSLLNLLREEKDQFIYSIQEKISLEKNLEVFLDDVKVRIINLNQEVLLGVGAAVPGPYYPAEDRISCNLIPGLERIGLKSMIKEYINLPVIIGNDVHLAALSEKEEMATPGIPLFYLFLSEGVGGAFIEDGHLIKGHNQFAGEIGLIKLENGKTVEEQISWLSFIKRMGYHADENEKDICDAILKRREDGEQKLKEEIEQISDVLARVLSYTVCLLNPGVISIGGKYHFLGEPFLNSIQTKLNKLIIQENSTDLILMFSGSEGRGTILGTVSYLSNLWLENLAL